MIALCEDLVSIKQIIEAIEEAGYEDTDYWNICEELKGGDPIWRELECRNTTYSKLKPSS